MTLPPVTALVPTTFVVILTAPLATVDVPGGGGGAVVFFRGVLVVPPVPGPFVVAIYCLRPIVRP